MCSNLHFSETCLAKSSRIGSHVSGGEPYKARASLCFANHLGTVRTRQQNLFSPEGKARKAHMSLSDPVEVFVVFFCTVAPGDLELTLERSESSRG